MWTATRSHDKQADRKLWGGAILFAAGVIALSYVELELVVRAPESMAADYVALASDLAPVLREGTHDASAKGSDALDKPSMINVRSSAAP